MEKAEEIPQAILDADSSPFCIPSHHAPDSAIGLDVCIGNLQLSLLTTFSKARLPKGQFMALAFSSERSS